MIDAVMLDIISDSFLRLNFLMNWLRRGGFGWCFGELWVGLKVSVRNMDGLNAYT